MSAFELWVIAGKTATILVVLLIAYRVLGKRQVGQMNVYDLVTLMAVANSVQNAMTEGRGEIGVGLTTSFTLIAIAYLATRFFILVPKLERGVYGDPVVLLINGKPDRQKMRSEHISEEELHEAMRQHGLVHFKEVGMAVLERDGSISVIPAGNTKRHSTQLYDN